MGLFGSDTSTETLDYEPEGDYVTAERIGKMDDVLDDDEEVMFVIEGKNIQEKGEGRGVLGSDVDAKNSLLSSILTGATDKRLVSKIPQMTGDDEQTIPYSRIEGVDLDTGLVTKKLTVKTSGSAYEFGVQDPDADEVREMARFIREKMKESQQATAPAASEPDPTEQLKNIKELHDDGVLSDEEFEEKKNDLLDQM
ncbi:PH domain-containing protein [Halorussus aquaticus]|uniref:PH domain-containing protein n=1 Tax=Halorussus aquaticus TaxID=2953748 RepID=A0ABD5Q4C6_9EURY|nr:PH domain-containing protein [Halorussus aquaticus]